jgi:hypothetical protein
MVSVASTAERKIPRLSILCSTVDFSNGTTTLSLLLLPALIIERVIESGPTIWAHLVGESWLKLEEIESVIADLYGGGLFASQMLVLSSSGHWRRRSGKSFWEPYNVSQRIRFSSQISERPWRRQACSVLRPTGSHGSTKSKQMCLTLSRNTSQSRTRRSESRWSSSLA